MRARAEPSMSKPSRLAGNFGEVDNPHRDTAVPVLTEEPLISVKERSALEASDDFFRFCQLAPGVQAAEKPLGIEAGKTNGSLGRGRNSGH